MKGIRIREWPFFFNGHAVLVLYQRKKKEEAKDGWTWDNIVHMVRFLKRGTDWRKTSHMIFTDEGRHNSVSAVRGGGSLAWIIIVVSAWNRTMYKRRLMDATASTGTRQRCTSSNYANQSKAFVFSHEVYSLHTHVVRSSSRPVVGAQMDCTRIVVWRCAIYSSLPWCPAGTSCACCCCCCCPRRSPPPR